MGELGIRSGGKEKERNVRGMVAPACRGFGGSFDSVGQYLGSKVCGFEVFLPEVDDEVEVVRFEVADFFASG